MVWSFSANPFVWALAMGVLGAIAGSFVAALVLRWSDDRSVMRGRSACDACGRTLAGIELVPLLSAPILHWRCRTCDAAIDPLHWRTEATATLIGASAGWVAAGPAALTGAVFGWLLLVLALLDWRDFWLPDRLTGALAIAGIATAAFGVAPPVGDRLIGGAVGFALLWIVARGYRALRGTEGMGAGDPKLLGGIGLWLGWRMIPDVLLVASLVGLGAVLALRLAGRVVARDDAVPFGTLLAIAAYPAWLVMIGLAS